MAFHSLMLNWLPYLTFLLSIEGTPIRTAALSGFTLQTQGFLNQSKGVSNMLERNEASQYQQAATYVQNIEPDTLSLRSGSGACSDPWKVDEHVAGGEHQSLLQEANTGDVAGKIFRHLGKI